MSATGPFITTINLPSQGRYERKESYRQPRPYIEPLPYFHGRYHDGRIYSNQRDHEYDGPGVVGSESLLAAQGDTDPLGTRSLAYARAYDRFVSKMKRNAQLGVGLAEVSSSFTMIRNRSIQLLGALSALRRRDFQGLALSLNLVKEEKKDRARIVWNRQSFRTATLANLLLEYQFGWAPLVADIAAAVNVLQSDFSDIPITGIGTANDSYSSMTYPFSGASQKTQLSVKSRVVVRAVVIPSNPNLALANQLGFVNPVSVAWQVLPASFLFDWFLPVGRFLESYSDFWGFSVLRTSVSHKLEVTRSYDTITPDDGYTLVAGNSDRAQSFSRTTGPLGIPGLLDRIRLPGGDLRGKATSTVAMLVQQLSNRK